MKGFTLSLFYFIIWWFIVFPSVDENENIYSSLERQTTTHQDDIMVKIKNNLNIDEYNMINMVSDTVNSSQDFFYTQDLKKICHAEVNEFIWKYPIINSDDDDSSEEEQIFKFRTINDGINFSSLSWYLESINGINIVEMKPGTNMHQIQFWVLIKEQTISLSQLNPTYPEISGFQILQFITNLAFQCEFFIHVLDLSEISQIYSALYDKSYYEYHFEGINDLNQNFLFKKIIVNNTHKFLNCFEEKITGRNSMRYLSQLFYKNIQTCENSFISVEFCPITFETHNIFYKKGFKVCIDWSPIGGFPGRTNLPFSDLSHFFEITSENKTPILKNKKSSNINNFVKLNLELNKKVIKTYDEIKIQIFDTSFLMGLFSKIFRLCWLELKEQKSDPNPEDIFKIYLRPCVIPNINRFLKYYTNVNYSPVPIKKKDKKRFHLFFGKRSKSFDNSTKIPFDNSTTTPKKIKTSKGVTFSTPLKKSKTNANGHLVFNFTK